MAMRNSARAARLGAIYAGIVFFAGFILGAARTMVIAPRTGDLVAVLIELPVILFISWMVFGRLAWAEAPFPLPSRWLAGLVAFLMLFWQELLVSAFITPGGVPAFLASFSTLPGGIGLAGQIAFAVFPVFHPAARN